MSRPRFRPAAACGIVMVMALASPLRQLAAQTRVVIVSGLGGEAKYSTEFRAEAGGLGTALHERFGVPDSNIVWFGEDSVSRAPRFHGQSTKANIEKAIMAMAAKAAPASQFVLVLIGHGAGEGTDTRISIPGPDLDATDFARLLAAFPTQRVALINLTSASGDMVPVVAGDNRVIITATKTAFERNESHFGQYFVEAFAKDGADADKDGRVSLLEAFRYAALETKRFYDNASLLQTEHPQLAYGGAKEGTGDPTGRTGDGALARRFFMDAGKAATLAAANDPKLSALYGEQYALQEQIDQIRAKQGQMTADAYDTALEPLLISLARKSR
ncbi:MAG: hypothetical protein ACREN6_05475, partial [Gemmatimonadaceae bacterium]